jgi:hypothetical protein
VKSRATGTVEQSNGKAHGIEPLNRIDEQAVTPVGRRASRYVHAVGTRAQDIDLGSSSGCSA